MNLIINVGYFIVVVYCLSAIAASSQTYFNIIVSIIIAFLVVGLSEKQVKK